MTQEEAANFPRFEIFGERYFHCNKEHPKPSDFPKGFSLVPWYHQNAEIIEVTPQTETLLSYTRYKCKNCGVTWKVPSPRTPAF